MSSFQRILVPVDLFEVSQPAIDLATTLAEANQAELIFCYVDIPQTPQMTEFGQLPLDLPENSEEATLAKIRPSCSSVTHRHHILYGNPGPEIIRYAKESQCDLIVLATHGRKGFIRLLLGSVAEYIIRNASVPVISIKEFVGAIENQDHKAKAQVEAALPPRSNLSPFVTSAMSHAIPVAADDTMASVLARLNECRSTSAIVTDADGKCIGIVTETDVQRYLDVWKRFTENDASTLDSVYDTDDYGCRRIDRDAFHRVRKHMTCPVVSVTNDATFEDACTKFQQHGSIHHLVVLDENENPLGIVKPQLVLPPSECLTSEAGSLESAV